MFLNACRISAKYQVWPVDVAFGSNIFVGFQESTDKAVINLSFNSRHFWLIKYWNDKAFLRHESCSLFAMPVRGFPEVGKTSEWGEAINARDSMFIG